MLKSIQNSQSVKLNKLLEWFKSENIWLNPDLLEVVVNHPNTKDESFFIKAKQAISEDDIVCKIPKTSILSCQTGGLSNLLEDGEIGGGVGLALSIMFELQMKEKSPWYSYLNSLPDFEPIPLFWDTKQLLTLKGTRVLSTLNQLTEELRTDYDEIVAPFIADHKNILSEEYFNFECYKRVTSWISSRAFDVDNFHGRAMVPLADLFNHHITAENVHIECDSEVCPYCGSNGTCAHYDQLEDLDDETPLSVEEVFRDHDIPPLQDIFPSEPERNLNDDDNDQSEDINDYMMEMRIVRPAKKGEEVFNTYGEGLPNDYLLTRYGFSEVDNPFDIIYYDLNTIGQTAFKLSKLSKDQIEGRIQQFLDWVPQLLPIIAPHLIPTDEEEAEEEMSEFDSESVHSEINNDESDDENSENESQIEEVFSEGDDEEDDEEQEDNEDPEEEIRSLIEKVKYGIEFPGQFSASLICLLNTLFSENSIFDSSDDADEILHYFEQIIEKFPLSSKSMDYTPTKKKVKLTISEVDRQSISFVRYLIESDLKEIQLDSGSEKEFEELKSKFNNNRNYIEYFGTICRINEINILKKCLASIETIIN